jgi:hypothetical protein
MRKLFTLQNLLVVLFASVSLDGCMYIGSVPSPPLVSTTIVECGPGTRPDSSGVCR